MSAMDIDKFYVSPYDKFLREYDSKHVKTTSQIKEIDKHARIAHLRDEKIQTQDQDKIWSDF